MKAHFLQPFDDVGDGRGVRNRGVRVGTSRRFGRIKAVLAPNLVQALGSHVVRLQGLVVDRPRRRHAVG